MNYSQDEKSYLLVIGEEIIGQQIP